MFVERADRQKQISRIVDRAECRFDFAPKVRRFAQKPLGSGRGVRHLQSGLAFRSFDFSRAICFPR